MQFHHIQMKDPILVPVQKIYVNSQLPFYFLCNLICKYMTIFTCYHFFQRYIYLDNPLRIRCFFLFTFGKLDQNLVGTNFCTYHFGI